MRNHQPLIEIRERTDTDVREYTFARAHTQIRKVVELTCSDHF